MATEIWPIPRGGNYEIGDEAQRLEFIADDMGASILFYFPPGDDGRCPMLRVPIAQEAYENLHDSAWSAAKKEAYDVMLDRISRGQTISYSDLAIEIRSLRLRPNSARLYDILCVLSVEEHREGRGMLSAVVVHARGDKMPGKGFFQLAESLGFDTENRREFWEAERDKVYQAHSQR